jgi:hypothetical protein
MTKETQISAFIARETRDMLDQYVAETGVKKGRVIEDALRTHLQALKELPADVIIPSEIVVSCESFKQIVEADEQPGRPSQALIDLMAADGD